MNNEADSNIGYWVISGFLILLGLVGLVLAANAVDQAILAFGLSLMVFSVLFCFFAIDRAHAGSARKSE